MTPLEVLELWFEAHARGDLDSARNLMTEDAAVTLADGASLRGFDAFMEWYRARRDREGPTFSYEVIDLLGGAGYAAAVIRLRRDDTDRRQIAVYAVSRDRITSVAMFEDEARTWMRR